MLGSHFRYWQILMVPTLSMFQVDLKTRSGSLSSLLGLRIQSHLFRLVRQHQLTRLSSTSRVLLKWPIRPVTTAIMLQSTLRDLRSAATAEICSWRIILVTAWESLRICMVNEDWFAWIFDIRTIVIRRCIHMEWS